MEGGGEDNCCQGFWVVDIGFVCYVVFSFVFVQYDRAVDDAPNNQNKFPGFKGPCGFCW